MAKSEVVALAKNLIARESVTPNDDGCQQMMADYLKQCGFEIESMVFDDTTNMWARRNQSGPLFCFAGHTDVVPVGKLSSWKVPPFEPTIIDGMLYGRGAADMKGSLAAMLVATKRFVSRYPEHKGSIAFLITSDEEGPFINGTVKVIETLEARNEKIDWCLVGEPSSTDKIGDVIKNGRRGSLTGNLIVHGIQGHVAYPHLAKNPIHLATPALTELAQNRWDEGNKYFPPTSFQIANIAAGTGAANVVPGELEVQFNFRFCTESHAHVLKIRTQEIFDRHGLDYDLNWILNGEPFLTGDGELLAATKAAIHSVTGYHTDPQTSGGTSDGRFIAPTGAQVIELGPCNATIHQVNECVSIDDLDSLADIYEQLMVNLLC